MVDGTLRVRIPSRTPAYTQVSSCRAEMVAAGLELTSALEAGGAGSNADVRLAAHDDAVWARLVSFTGNKRMKVRVGVGCMKLSVLVNETNTRDIEKRICGHGETY